MSDWFVLATPVGRPRPVSTSRCPAGPAYGSPRRGWTETAEVAEAHLDAIVEPVRSPSSIASAPSTTPGPSPGRETGPSTVPWPERRAAAASCCSVNDGVAPVAARRPACAWRCSVRTPTGPRSWAAGPPSAPRPHYRIAHSTRCGPASDPSTAITTRPAVDIHRPPSAPARGVGDRRGRRARLRRRRGSRAPTSAGSRPAPRPATRADLMFIGRPRPRRHRGRLLGPGPHHLRAARQRPAPVVRAPQTIRRGS